VRRRDADAVAGYCIAGPGDSRFRGNDEGLGGFLRSREWRLTSGTLAEGATPQLARGGAW
jgi:hypothetical protein